MCCVNGRNYIKEVSSSILNQIYLCRSMWLSTLLIKHRIEPLRPTGYVPTPGVRGGAGYGTPGGRYGMGGYGGSRRLLLVEIMEVGRLLNSAAYGLKGLVGKLEVASRVPEECSVMEMDLRQRIRMALIERLYRCNMFNLRIATARLGRYGVAVVALVDDDDEY